MYAADLYSKQKTASTTTTTTTEDTTVTEQPNIDIDVATSSKPILIEVDVPFGKGRDATVNGYNTVLINAEDGITLTQEGKVLTLTSPDIKNKIDKSEKGVANGVATLGADGIVPDSQLPDFGCSTFVFEQAIPSKTWNIEHNMKKIRPSVTIVDSADDVVMGDIKYIDDTHVELSFSVPFTGKAYLN